MRNKKRPTSARFKNPYFKERSPFSVRQWVTTGDGWAYLLSMLLLLVVVGYVFISQRWLVIDYVTVTGNSFLTTTQIAEPTKEALQQRRWLVVPTRWYPWFNEQKFSDELYATLTEQYALESVSVTKHYYDRIEVTIEERVPGYVYTIGAGHYYMDNMGVVTEQVLNEADLNTHFPRIRDANTRTVSVGDTIMKPERVAFASDLVRDFTTHTGLDISELAFVEVTCQEKQFVAEEIFEDEIEGTEDDAIRAEKEFILEQLKEDEITVDQSLALLEEVKRVEFGEDGEQPVNPNGGFVELIAEFVPTECDYVAVLQDISVVTQQGFVVHFDTSIDLQTQLDNLSTVVRTSIESVDDIEYIDVRFEDKVFYR